jgi:hypothetical protein
MVRESLEAVVAPSIVSTVIFEALEQAGGQLPTGPEAVRDFANGALRRALVARLGDGAHSICDDVVTMLESIAPRPVNPPEVRRDFEVTREVVIDALPVFVIVIAGSGTLAGRLQAALGSNMMTATPTTSLEQLHEHLGIAAPQVVLIDAADFANIEPDPLALVLEQLPATTVRGIWGADLPYGAAILRALAGRGSPATPLDRREGIAPLLDLVRSRRGQDPTS